MDRHFTATAYLFHNGKVLLHRHPKLGKWLPPGGHLEVDETPPEGARREVKEETGLDIQFIKQENIEINAYNAVSFERPFLCLLEQIPATASQPVHQHMDMIYLAVPADERQLKAVPEEFRWFAWEDLEPIKGELFPDTLQVLNLLLRETTNGDDALFLSQAISAAAQPSCLDHRKR